MAVEKTEAGTIIYPFELAEQLCPEGTKHLKKIRILVGLATSQEFQYCAVAA